MSKLRKKFLELLLCVLILFTYVIGYGESQSKSFLIDCGSNTTTEVDGRTWVGDLSPNKSVTLQGFDAITASTSKGGSVFGEIYKTARVFEAVLNYTFEGITQGNYFVRLHFSPFPIENHNVNESSFSVFADGLRLMLDINIAGEIAHKNLILESTGHNATASSLVKEFLLPMGPGKLVLSFMPEKGSFGFVNAIEILLVDDKLFKESVTKVGGSEVELGLGRRGIETMYRLNVGGPKLGPSQDLKLYRTWETDLSYMVIENAGVEVKNSSNITYAMADDSPVAPLLVYETARMMSNTEVLEKRFNISWKFEVDPNFDYLVRLHFCELLVDKQNQRIFRIYINNQTAAGNFDIFAHAGGKNKGIYQDYFDPVSSKNDVLWIQLGPDSSVGASGDALLSGLEIFKLSKNGNLAHLIRFDSTGHSVDDSKMRIIWISVGAGIATIIFFVFLGILVVCLCKKRRNKSNESKNNPPGWRPLFLHVNNSTANAKATGGSLRLNTLAASTMGRKFTLAEIRAATKNFDDGLAIGVGGFGKVYRGELEDGTLIAIKRATPHSQQGLAEFETEIVMLSRLRHRHLVSLIGFCDEHNEMILVYEYMANGTLRSHLFGSNLPPLSWKQRLEACIGSARGLHYLHTGSERGIIHRDVKTTNILLDENFVAKMSDFGLSKAGPSMDHTHVSTAVKGSFGYLDPEYFRRQQLTEKSDVYSFGVVLFEAVCARAVINPTLPKDQINLAEWALSWQKQRSLESIIDPNLRGNYSPESLEKYGEIAEKCLADEGKNRPMMGEVLWSLEYVLQLHEAWLRKQNGENSFSSSQAVEEAPESYTLQGCSNQDSSETEKSQTGSALHNLA
ncbi:LOW QUALITY PROTEIN: probable receptor-like protein kinase At1g30570 [Arabidopsis lyrata subsp. lyrata]|uniref:LOW QUALITY PROTEIN: probable receptor-like protein kinase At1g30570 n=1 Tax=Arabidopsis lyrata subsp. lyrata TaxID=81972 RepID=UPI000A29C49D|nr:LOW QUALITY PROTEIN: probable receptor-like protein kinase At1g30570 [Arabidopsis lyrata subsp. lyrata]|eukprot:XP_020866069.1 LOW QUALITY PROTEIN: probable receptor-like protein kinase At1g30570 [Arabidopsis lyrata subsp. lyrata]